MVVYPWKSRQGWSRHGAPSAFAGPGAWGRLSQTIPADPAQAGRMVVAVVMMREAGHAARRIAHAAGQGESPLLRAILVCV